jgi:predicted phosphodiesterase
MKKTLIITDIHSPFENQILLEKVFKLMTRVKFDELVLGGDFLDLFSISQYAQNSLYKLEGLSLGLEYTLGKKVLKIFETFDCQKVFMYGNHEARFQKWIEQADNRKLAGAISNVRDGLELDKWKVYDDWLEDSHTIGKDLSVIHGVYTNIHCAKNHLDKFHGQSLIFGHTHRIQVATNDKHASYNIGGLFDKHSKGFRYMLKAQRGQWLNGFAVVNTTDNGEWYVNLVTCYNDKFVFEGYEY